MTVVGGEVIERDIPGIGLLRFENCKAGEWLTKRGEPAKKGRRRYLLGGEEGDEMDSVSSIVGTLDAPALLHWFEDHGARGGAKAALMGELDGVPDEEILDRVKLLGLGASAQRDEAADRGTAVHLAFETLGRGEPLRLSTYPAEWRGWMQGVARAWLALNPTVRESEQIVCHREHGYAGRFDLFADAGGPALIDYKSGKGKVYDKAHYQTRLYEMARRACGMEPADRIVIVGVDNDGGFQLVECEATEEDALALLHTFKGRKRINAGMAAQRKALKAAAKAAETIAA
jgi:hypothetical protein